MKSVLIVLTAAFALGACGNSPKKTAAEDTTSEAGTLYDRAKRALDNKQFDSAIAEFENLEANYPFGDHAQQAQLDVTYAYYKEGEYDNAIAGAERFLKLYPQSQHTDYAWYLKGLINFSRGRGLLEKLVPRKPFKMDQAALRNSFNDFSTLLRQHPDSIYSNDARQRLVYLRNEMARHELSVAQYYYKRSAMVAVINRVNFMLEQFADSPYSADGLALMTRAYLDLGNLQLATDTLKTLELNAPKHPALKSLKSRV